MQQHGWLIFCLIVSTIFFIYQTEHVEVEGVYTSLEAENKTYRLDLARQHTNLKECMSKITANEVQDFYKRHREEFKNAK